MKQFILYAMSVLTVSTYAMDAQNSELIQRYHNFAFAQMRPTTQIFIADFPEDPKTKIINRYLHQLSFASLLYKYKNGYPSNEEIPTEVRHAYRCIPPNAFVYHIITRGEIVEDQTQLPYDHFFNPKQSWQDYLAEIEEQMATQLENPPS